MFDLRLQRRHVSVMYGIKVPWKRFESRNQKVSDFMCPFAVPPPLQAATIADYIRPQLKSNTPNAFRHWDMAKTVQTERLKGELSMIRWLKWHWTWHGCWCQTSWSEFISMCHVIQSMSCIYTGSRMWPFLSLSLFKGCHTIANPSKMSSSKCHLGLSLLWEGCKSFTHRKAENYITLHVLQSESVCHI